MNFVSWEFLVFFVAISSLYWLLEHRSQNLLLLVGSYIFYGWWDYRFLALLLFSSIFDYWCGLLLDRLNEAKIRKLIVGTSIAVNLGLLGVFKYFNFFVDSLQHCLATFGIATSLPVLNVLLPVGISFYTFQTLSYTIDVYCRRLKPASGCIDFMLYVSFFPQLVAGPIERATHLLPQVLNKRRFSLPMAASGVQLAIVGFFKKMVIADNLSPAVDAVYGDSTANGLSVVLATYAFAFQIYCDFSGYTDIARGISRTLGFDLSENFRLPYFAISPSDFWQRWHISLSRWLRDYLYIPLGGNRSGSLTTVRNLAVTMLLGGLWHGASLHFVVWGGYQALLLIAYRLLTNDERMPNEDKLRSGLLHWLKVVFFFQLTCYGWLLFRASNMHQVVSFSQQIFLVSEWQWTHAGLLIKHLLLVLVIPLISFQIYQYYRRDNEPWRHWHLLSQALFFVVLTYVVMLLGAGKRSEFIYFQF